MCVCLCIQVREETMFLLTDLFLWRRLSWVTGMEEYTDSHTCTDTLTAIWTGKKVSIKPFEFNIKLKSSLYTTACSLLWKNTGKHRNLDRFYRNNWIKTGHYILNDRESNHFYQLTFIVTSPQHKCLGEWNSYERAPDSAKNIYIYILHMDSTYLQTLQKTMCKIHIHILSIHSVL